MHSLKETSFDELPLLEKLSKQIHIGKHLNFKTVKAFQDEYELEDIRYLNILTVTQEIAGYIILKKEPSKSQLKRIVIDERHLGIGKEVLTLVEVYCIEYMDVNFLWLDVYADNKRAIRLYEKSGYVRYNEGMENHREVWFYRKYLIGR